MSCEKVMPLKLGQVLVKPLASTSKLGEGPCKRTNPIFESFLSGKVAVNKCRNVLCAAHTEALNPLRQIPGVVSWH